MSAGRTTAETAVASPCNSVCTIDAATGLCEGCLRTLDEIALWSTLDDAARRSVIAAIGERRRHAPSQLRDGKR